MARSKLFGLNFCIALYSACITETAAFTAVVGFVVVSTQLSYWLCSLRS